MKEKLRKKNEMRKTGRKKEENEGDCGEEEEGRGSGGEEGKTTLRFTPSAFLNFSEKFSYAF
jgi:hypothetical protein